MLITTTHTLQGKETVEYKVLVTVRNVRAVKVIRDFFTGFRDFFGGRSGSYQDVNYDILES